MMTENSRHYCAVPMPADIAAKDRAALLNEFKWEPGTEFTIRFLAGEPGLRQRVALVAQEWTGPEMANLGLRFVENGDADVRIAFAQGDGSWSYLGTMCHQIPAGQPTMNYGWLTPESGDD